MKQSDRWPGAEEEGFDHLDDELGLLTFAEAGLPEPSGRGRQEGSITLRQGPGGPRDFFWASLAPLSVFAAFSLSVLTLVFATWTTTVEFRELLILGFSVFALSVGLLLPAQYYVVTTRLERPLRRLERELLGETPWRPEGDILFAPLRRAAEHVRQSALAARSGLAREESRVRDLQERVAMQVASERFIARAADGLRSSENASQFALDSAQLVCEVWPAEDVVLLARDADEGELEVLFHIANGELAPVAAPDQSGRRYRRASLPVPLKEAQRRGFFEESGLPFSHDPTFPEARSFVAMALDHRGSATGFLLATTKSLLMPTAEPLRRAQPLFSMAYSRVMYLREMEDAAIRDALTGLYTYDHFLGVMRQEVARSNRYARPVACLMLDVDNLRRINSTYGPGAGDQAIAEVAQLTRGALRSSDTLARLSGGRLAALLPEAGMDACLAVAERVLSTIEEHAFILRRGVVDRVTVTLGLAAHPPFGVTAMALVDAAHVALLEAKASGPNRYAVAGPEAFDQTPGLEGLDPPPALEGSDGHPPAPATQQQG